VVLENLMEVSRSRDGLAFHLPDLDAGHFILVSIHDTYDDISWLGVMPSISRARFTVEIPEPCLSGHSFDVLIYLCEQIRSDDTLLSAASGSSVIQEWFINIPLLKCHRRLQQTYPAWGK
jgi:hypothetical protein